MEKEIAREIREKTRKEVGKIRKIFEIYQKLFSFRVFRVFRGQFSLLKIGNQEVYFCPLASLRWRSKCS